MRRTRQTANNHGYRWLAGALSLASVSLAACSHPGWIIDGTEKGAPDAGGVGTGGSGGVYGDGGVGIGGDFGGTGIGGDYGGYDAGGASDGAVGYADGGIATGGTFVWGTGGTPGVAGTGGTPGTGDAPGTSACFDVTFDHDVLCDDIVDAKDQAGADCQRHGLELTAFGPAGDCHAGDSRRLTYTCCTASALPPPPPDRTSPACANRITGNGTTCQSLAALKSAAAADCAASNYDLTDDNEGIGACGGSGYQLLSYYCCTRDGSIIPPPQPDPPPPTSPFDGPIVSGPSRYAEYKCCTSTTACTVEMLGSPSDCKDATGWNAVATAACSARGGTLYGVPLFESCSL